MATVTGFVVWGPVVVWVVRPIPAVVVVVVGIVEAIVGRVPTPEGIVVRVTIVGIAVIWIAIVVGVSVAIVDVRASPATAKHCGDVARLNPNLIAHNHNGIESGVVGQGEEVRVAIAVVVVRRGHLVGGRREAPEPALVGTLVVIYVDVVVGVVYHHPTRRCSAGHHWVVEVKIAQQVVDIGLGIGGCYHCVNPLFALGGCGCNCCGLGSLLLGQSTLGGCNSHAVVGAIEVVGICCTLAGSGAHLKGYARAHKARQSHYRCDCQ